MLAVAVDGVNDAVHHAVGEGVGAPVDPAMCPMKTQTGC